MEEDEVMARPSKYPREQRDPNRLALMSVHFIGSAVGSHAGFALGRLGDGW